MRIIYCVCVCQNGFAFTFGNLAAGHLAAHSVAVAAQDADGEPPGG